MDACNCLDGVTSDRFEIVIGRNMNSNANSTGNNRSVMVRVRREDRHAKTIVIYVHVVAYLGGLCRGVFRISEQT